MAFQFNAQRENIKIKPPQAISGGAIMKSANRLGHQASKPTRGVSSKVTRPNHQAFHGTKNSLGAHRF